MTKKTLKEKINCVKWSALLFAIIYFVIGAWLKSDGPKFDPDKTYELIKDSLTLTAYFLAPVAAFVLFSDWRDQHVEIENERISRIIVQDILPIINKSNTDFFIHLNDAHGMFNFREHYFNNLYKLKSDVEKIYSINSNALEFKKNGGELSKRLIEGFMLMDVYLGAKVNEEWRIEHGFNNESQIKISADKIQKALSELFENNEKIRLLISQLKVLTIV